VYTIVIRAEATTDDLVAAIIHHITSRSVLTVDSIQSPTSAELLQHQQHGRAHAVKLWGITKQ